MTVAVVRRVVASFLACNYGTGSDRQASCLRDDCQLPVDRHDDWSTSSHITDASQTSMNAMTTDDQNTYLSTTETVLHYRNNGGLYYHYHYSPSMQARK